MKRFIILLGLGCSLTLPVVAEEEVAKGDPDNVPALTQLMNARMFKGLSICTTDPWKGLEYTKNLELDYLQWALNLAQTQEQTTLHQQVSEFIIRSGRELQAVREKCLTTGETEAAVPKLKLEVNPPTNP